MWRGAMERALGPSWGPCAVVRFDTSDTIRVVSQTRTLLILLLPSYRYVHDE